MWERLQEAGFKLMPSKCDLFRLPLTFWAIDAEGIDREPSKVTALNSGKALTQQCGGCAFVPRPGLAGYYQNHVADYADRAAPLIELTMKNSMHNYYIILACANLFEFISIKCV